MTILDKDISRETTVKVDEREIQITLTESQNISLKLKGMKSGAVEIGIGVLYGQLKGGTPAPAEVVTEKKVEVKRSTSGTIDISSYKDDEKYLISLHEIRSSLLVSDMDLGTKQIFEKFMVALINERKEKIGK